eukprot:8675224-Pyramimonas_sp.AAC.1
MANQCGFVARRPDFAETLCVKGVGAVPEICRAIQRFPLPATARGSASGGHLPLISRKGSARMFRRSSDSRACGGDASP